MSDSIDCISPLKVASIIATSLLGPPPLDGGDVIDRRQDRRSLAHPDHDRSHGAESLQYAPTVSRSGLELIEPGSAQRRYIEFRELSREPSEQPFAKNGPAPRRGAPSVKRGLSVARAVEQRQHGHQCASPRRLSGFEHRPFGRNLRDRVGLFG